MLANNFQLNEEQKQNLQVINYNSYLYFVTCRLTEGASHNSLSSLLLLSDRPIPYDQVNRKVSSFFQYIAKHFKLRRTATSLSPAMFYSENMHTDEEAACAWAYVVIMQGMFGTTRRTLLDTLLPVNIVLCVLKFLGRIAVGYYVGLSVCHSCEPCKTAEPIEVPFGMWTWVGWAQGTT